MMVAGVDAMAHVKTMHHVSKNEECGTLVASLRDAQQILKIAEIGHDRFTISPNVAHNLFQSNLTVISMVNFEKSALGELS